MNQTSSRRRAVARFLTGSVAAAFVATGLPAPASTPAPAEVQVEEVALSPRPPRDRVSAAGDRAVRVAPAGPARPGWRARSAPSVAPQLVGFTWAGDPTGAVQVRARSGDGGSWGEWYDVHASPDEGPDPSTGEGAASTVSAGPVWLGDEAREVEVRVEEGLLADLRMTAIRSSDPAPASGFGIEGAGALPGAPGIVPRSSWGAAPRATGNPGCGQDPSYYRPGFGVLHHTVNGNDYAPEQADDLLRGIQTFHTRTNGWCDIAYNFLVDRYGRVYEGRAGGVDRGVVGGHTKGFNLGAIGVSLLGDHSLVRVTPAAAGAVRSLLTWKFGLHGIDAGDTTREISGGSTKYANGQLVTLPRLFAHRDVSLTSCPGGFAFELLPGLRRSVQSAVVTSVPDPLPAWDPDGAAPRLHVLDAHGGLNPAGRARSVGHGAHWPGLRIARGATSDGGGRGYVVDGFGGVHPFGGAARVRVGSYFAGRDLARGITDSDRGRGWVVDAYGGLHPYGAAPARRPSFYVQGFDIVRGVAARAGGGGGWVLDGYGGLHEFGSAKRRRPSAYWPQRDIARAIATRPDGRGGYVLDAFGGVHPFGGAPELGISHYTDGVDTFRSLVLRGRGSSGYAVDRDGKAWPVGSAPSVRTSRTWVGQNLSRGAA